MEIIKKFNFKFVLLFFFIAFFIPGGSSYFLNGFPVNGKVETLFLIFFPIIIFNNFVNIKKKKIVFLLLLISFLKILSINGPKIGILHKQFETKEKDQIIKTYDSFWNGTVSSIQTFNWPEKKYFSIDWLMGEKISKNDNLRFENINEFETLKLFIKSNFSIISNGSYFRIKNFNTQNLESYYIIDLQDNNYVDNSVEFFTNKGLFLPKGVYGVEININFKDNWNLEFENSVNIFNENYYLSSFWLSNIFQNNDNKKYFELEIFKIIGNLIDFSFLFLIFFLIYELFIVLKKKKYLPSFLSFCILLLSLCFLFKQLLFETDYFRFFDTISLSITYLIFLVFFFHKFLFKNDLKIYDYNYLKIFFSITLISFFSFKFYSLIGVIDFYTNKGDDWFTFQVFAREIAVGKIFPHPDTIYRPGLKYLFAIQHILFGKSSFVAKLLEIWLLLFSLFLTFKIILNFTKNYFLGLIGVFLISIIFLGENYVNYLGKGLSSYYSYVCVLSLIYFFISKKIDSKNIFYTIPFVLLIAWLREEQLILTCSLIFFIPEISKNFKSQKKIYFLFFFLRNQIVLRYFMIVFVSLISVLIFHKQSFNLIDFITHPNVGFTYKENSSSLESIYRLITGTNNLGDTPRLYSPLFVIILLISILNFFNKFNTSNINSGFFISNLSIYFTYIFLTNVNYNPRYCINLLFINLIYFLIFLYFINKEKNYFLFLSKFFSRKQ